MSPEYLELHRWMGLPFAWGETDCIMVLGDWIARVRNVDPFAGDRFTYDDAGSCQRATGFFSDPVGVIDDRLGRAGLRRGNDLRAGDVAVVSVPGQRRPVGALWTGDCWGFKGPDGATTVRADLVEVLAFWSVRDAA